MLSNHKKHKIHKLWFVFFVAIPDTRPAAEFCKRLTNIPFAILHAGSVLPLSRNRSTLVGAEGLVVESFEIMLSFRRVG